MNVSGYSLSQPKIIKARPPNFDQILVAFGSLVMRPTVIFAFNDAIYVPGGQSVPDHLIAHERVHLSRQGGSEWNALAWWENYIADPAFRFSEELLAHKAEYKSLMQGMPSRQVRRGALKEVAKRLASPLYGSLITPKQAAELISEGIA